MKKIRITRLLALALCLVMTGTAFVALFPVHAATEVNVQNGTGTREPIRVGKTYSYRAILNGEFTAFGLSMPTWTKSDSYATLYLFKWLGSYERTVASTPVASKRFDPLKDGEFHWVEFDAQPAGEYLFHVADGGADVGVWTNTVPTGSKGFLYINGVEQRGEPSMKVRFTDQVAEPFGQCEASGKLTSSQLPYTRQADEAVFDMSGPAGVRLHTAAPFVGVRFKLATYMAKDLETDISVYAWKGTYEATVKETPVASDRLILVDNAVQGITFEELPAGDYLFLVENFTKAPAVYVYNTAEDFKGYVYRDGFPVEGKLQYPVMQLVFTEESEEYFVECAKPQDALTGEHEAPPPYVIPSDSLIYTHPVMPDTWVFTDGLGRVSLTNAEVGDLKEDKTLAMFYWTWHIDGFAGHAPVNLQEYSEKYPEAMRDWDSPVWKDADTFWWNESVYGYYRGDDKWVLRKQAELLTNAGVDVIFTDNTNGTLTWRNAYTPLMEAWTEAMEEGLKTPKVSFMLPFWDQNSTNAQVQSLYLDVFRTDRFHNLWFYWDNKPMLMGLKSAFNPSQSVVDKEIYHFFTFRAGQPGYLVEQTQPGSWGWLSMYPQALYYKNAKEERQGIVEQMTVGVAQNHNYQKQMLAAMSGDFIAGRSYSSTFPDRYEKEGTEASKWGYNFAEQWTHALEVDPRVIFVTGWNEFRVGRYRSWPDDSPAAVENAFPDQFNDEFSRDIEPSKGALQDHYYYQLVNFSRQFKGARPIPTPSAKKTMDLTAGYDQWRDVEPYFGAYIGNTEHRNAQGYGDLVYTETSGRNDIIGAQVARDDEFLYFLVECARDITPYTDALWMNLYLDVDQSRQGWNTFDFVLGKSGTTANTMTLEQFTVDNDYAQTRKVADAAYTVDGRYMTLKVAKADLGLEGDDFTVNFAWTDNVHDEGDYTGFSGDIMDFYISGDVAPGGRFKYSYVSTATVGEPETDTSEQTEAPTAHTDPVETEDSQTHPETKASEKGCRSALGMGVATVLSAMAAAVVMKRSKED